MDSDYSDFELSDHPLTRNGPDPNLSVDYLMEPSIPKAPTLPKALLRLRNREVTSDEDRLPDYNAQRRTLTTRPSMRRQLKQAAPREPSIVPVAAKRALESIRAAMPRSVLPMMSVGALSGLFVMLVSLFFR